MHLKIVDEAFYVLKSHMIKSSKGNKQILDCISTISSKKRKKYPKSNSIVNNVLNLLLDVGLLKVLSIVLKSKFKKLSN